MIIHQAINQPISNLFLHFFDLNLKLFRNCPQNSHYLKETMNCKHCFFFWGYCFHSRKGRSCLFRQTCDYWCSCSRIRFEHNFYNRIILFRWGFNKLDSSNLVVVFFLHIYSFYCNFCCCFWVVFFLVFYSFYSFSLI